MKHDTVRATAFAMPLTNPAFPSGPYRFVNREYFIIQYRTDPEALRRIVPEPLTLTEPVMNYEFIRMPDSTGFGDYTESGQVIPVSYRGEAGSFVHQMFLNDHPPIALVEKQISDIAGQKGISQKEQPTSSWPKSSPRWNLPHRSSLAAQSHSCAPLPPTRLPAPRSRSMAAGPRGRQSK
jgi:hypothetical protein